MTDHLEVFQGKNGKWYWRRKARNGKIAGRDQGYARKDGAKRGALRAFPGRPVRFL